MKIKSQTLMVNISNNVIFEKAGISLKAIHQVMIYEGDEGEILNDFELIDYEDVTYLGMPIEGYKGVNKLRTQLKEWGINFEEAIDQECGGLIDEKFLDKQISNFKSVVG